MGYEFFRVKRLGHILGARIDVDPIAFKENSGNDVVESSEARREFDRDETGFESDRCQKGVQQKDVAIAVSIRDPLLENVGQEDVRSRHEFEAMRIRDVPDLFLHESDQIAEERLEVVVVLRSSEFDRAAPNRGELRVIVPDPDELAEDERDAIPQGDYPHLA